MSDAPENTVPEPNRPLSEIGHLFLSSIRERQTNGAARPQRKGPATNADVEKSVDITAQEFGQAHRHGLAPDSVQDQPATKPVTAILAAHLNGRQIDRSREYAAHIAASHGRIGLIEVDASEFRLMLFERHASGSHVDTSEIAIPASEPLDVRRMQEAMEELSWDVSQWLLLLPNPRSEAARELLMLVDRWTLLATCDHDGIVSGYRTLKSLCGEHEPLIRRPQVSLALMDVRSADEADRVLLKLSSVCDQFLHWKLESEPAVEPAPDVSNHLVLCCRSGREETGQPQFAVVRELITRSNQSALPEVEMSPQKSTPTPQKTSLSNAEEVIAALRSQATGNVVFDRVTAPAAARATETIPATNDESEVVDLVGEDANPHAVIAAFIKGRSGLAETSVKAPACPAASLTVSRDRKLVLVAVARQGLCDLRDIATAYRWLNENRPLIAMALPQFAIEPTHMPRLQLLVDQSDLNANELQPLLESEHVKVQTYRKLRWGGRIGLLLEAA